MKKLLRLMLCAILAVPSGAMSVQAAETQQTQVEEKKDEAASQVKAEEKEEEKVPETQTPEVTASGSNVILGGKEYDTAIANAGAECTIAVPLVNLGDTNVTNVVITPVLSEDVKSQMLNNIPLAALGKPEDIANLVVFLASDMASYITGQVMQVDGGMVM